MKICTDCRWVNTIPCGAETWYCCHPASTTRDPVDGHYSYQSCTYMRRSRFLCGPEGDYYISKHESIVSAIPTLVLSRSAPKRSLMARILQYLWRRERRR